ncbi:MAG TPA: pitrilysin family protein [Myxococcota bacterium]|nr:pitrilysin family protein [Myxococcota bacterium]
MALSDRLPRYRRVGRALGRCAGVCALLVATAPFAAAHAGPFSPPGLYDPAVYRLANGLQVVLRPRTGARSVAIRAVVGVGTSSYPCREQEVPHLLEHLLFSGTSSHSEEELDALISSHGGSWNAFTDDWETTYQVDIFSGNAALGVETLHEILTDTQISEDAIAVSRDVVIHEDGGAPGFGVAVLDALGLWESAHDRALARLDRPRTSACKPQGIASDVTRDEIEAAYHRYYVPANMTLVVVGDFDLDAMRATIARTFGRMPDAPFVAEPKEPLPPHPGAIALRGFASDASIGFLFRTGGYASPESWALRVLEPYLDQRLYQVLTVERGLTYDPEVRYSADPDVGWFEISAVVDSPDIELVRSLIAAELDRIRDRTVDLDALEKARDGLLLTYAQGIESNADVADYYVSSLFELEDRGRFVDEEEVLQSLRPESILEAGAKAFAADRTVSLRDRRLYTTEILAGSLLAVGGAAIYVPWRLVRRRRRRRGTVKT